MFNQAMADSYGYIWHAHVDDGAFTAWVTQEDDGYQGTLRVQRNSDSQTILECKVGISYAAQFGPDVADVNLWEDMVVDTIDRHAEESD